MLEKPDTLPRWATTNQIDPVNGDNNVVEPPEQRKDVGWQHNEAAIRNYFNWLGRHTYNYLKYLDDKEKITDGDGSEVVDQENVAIKVFAVNTATPTEYVVAYGYRDAATAPTLTVTSNNVLNVGTTTTDGDIPITGAAAGDVKLIVNMY